MNNLVKIIREINKQKRKNLAAINKIKTNNTIFSKGYEKDKINIYELFGFNLDTSEKTRFKEVLEIMNKLETKKNRKTAHQRLLDKGYTRGEATDLWIAYSDRTTTICFYPISQSTLFYESNSHTPAMINKDVLDIIKQFWEEYEKENENGK